MTHETTTTTEMKIDSGEDTAWATLCRIIGEDKAGRFCRAFARCRKVRIAQRKFFVFADVVGATAAKRIIDTFDGELLTLPSGLSDVFGAERNAAIAAAKGKLSQTELAKIAGISERQVRRIQKSGQRA